MPEYKNFKIQQGPIGVYSIWGFPKEFDSEDAARNFVDQYIDAPCVTLELRFEMVQNIPYQYRQIGDAYFLHPGCMVYEMPNGSFAHGDLGQSKSDVQKLFEDGSRPMVLHSPST